MKKILLLLITVLSTATFAQINMGNLGTVTTGCGQTFYDSGGSGGNYGANQNYTATFCAPAGQYITFTFTQFALSTGESFMIYNGPNTGSPLIGNYPSTSPGQVSSALGGCLTFVFTSDGNGLLGLFPTLGAGWAATISCATTIPPPPPPPPGSCAGAQPFCTSTGVTFPASVGTTSETGPNYGCLSTQPSPAWYYLNIATSGDIMINLSNSAAHDIDFAIWGPFATQASMCAGTTAAPIDCSYSTSATEQVDIIGAVAGQWYIMLITNYANTPTNINAVAGNAAGVDGTTNCNILCNMTGLTSTPGPCVSPANTYSVTGNITVAYPPTSGTLTVSSSCGGSVLVPLPWTSPIAYTLPGLAANGAACSITAVFSADPTCTLTTPYTAPASCSSTCTVTSVSATPSSCLAGNTYNLTGSVAFTGAPASGTMTVTNSCGGSQVFNAPFVSPLAYSLPGLTANGAACVVTASFSATACSLTQNYTAPSVPVVNAGVDQTVCVGSPATLTGSGASTYSWNNGITNAVAFTPAATLTYTLTGTNASGCTATDQAIVTVNPLATVNANIDQSVCAGGTVTLAGAIGGSATSGTWTAPSGTFSLATNLASTYTPSITSGTVTLTLTTNDPAGPCLAVTDIMVVTVNPLPVTNAGVDQTVCIGSPVTLTGSGASTYTWDNGVTNGVAFTPAATTTYTVTGTTAFGCIATDQVIVTVNPLATVNANIDQTVCAGGTVTLAGTIGGAAASSTWTAASGAFSNALSLTSTYTPSITSGTITLTLTTNDPTGPCLAVNDQMIITVNPLPVVNAGPDQAICIGVTPVTLTGSGASTYTWNNGVTNGVAFAPAATTTYTVTGTSAAGCINTDQVIVTVNPLPVVNAGVDQTICIGASVTLSGSGASTYTWNNGVTNGVAFAPAATTTYTVTGTSAAGCINTDQVVVTVNPLPVVVANDISVCVGGTVALTAAGASTYTWSPATYLSATTGASVNFTAGLTTTYTVSGTSAAGCVSTDPITVSVLANAPINAGPDVALCAGASTTLTATGGVTYSWNNGLGIGNNFSVTPAATTTYTVVGTDAVGCTGTDAITVTVNPLPIVNAGLDQTVCSGTTVTLSGAGAATYTWNNGVTNAVGFVPAVGTVTYTVTGTTAAGCTATDQVVVTVNPLPVVNAGIDQTVCSGTAVTLTGAGAATYTWTGGVTNGVAFTPVATTTYTVTGTTAVGCTATDQVIVTVNPMPTTNAGVDQTVCSGTSVTLTAVGASTYTWNNGVTNGIAFVPAVGSITYTVTGTSAAGCILTDQVIVTVNPNPVPVINGPTAYCVGFSALLSTSTPFTTYLWSNGATTATLAATIANNPITVTVTNGFGCSAVSPVFTVTQNAVITANFTNTICQGQSSLIHGVNQTVAGVYSQTFVSATGCDSVANVTLVVNPLPPVNAGVDQAVCTTVATTLTATGATTYTWDNGVTNGIPFTQAIGSTTYTVTGTSAFGCINTDQVIVTVNPLPIVSAGPDQAICIGASATISGSGASTYTWNNGVTNAVAFAPALTNTYTVTGTDVNGCINTDQVVVTVNPLPAINAGADQVTCIGGSVTLTATGGTLYSWNNGITNGVAFSPAATTTYTVTGTDANGCINTDQAVVTVNPLPIVNAGLDQTVCIGTSVTLTGTGASTYTWDNGVTNGTAFTPAVGTITYTVTGTSGATCISTDQVTVTVNPLPVTDAGPDQVICIGASVTLTGAGANTYSWDNGVVNGVSFAPSATTTYTVIGTSAFGCVLSDQVVVTVNPLPIVFAGNDVTLCENQMVTLTGSGAANYTWDNGVINGTAFTPAVGTVVYTVTGTSAAGCINTDQVSVLVNPLPSPSFTPDVTLGCLPLTVNFTNLTANASNCVWTVSNGAVMNGCGVVSETFTQAGCFDVTLTTTSNAGCVNSFTAPSLVCVEAYPVASFSPSESVMTTLSTNVLFDNTTIGAIDYVWNFGDNSASSIVEDPEHLYPELPGYYTVTLIATSPLGCVDTTTATIQIQEVLLYYVPNTYTPDADNFNEVFKPIFTSGFDPQDYTLWIFDRWGNIIFESHNTDIGWDGTYGSNGEISMVQDGTYTWKIEFKVTMNDERKMIVGHVNVIR